MKHFDVELSYSVRVTQEDLGDSHEGEITAEDAERVALDWMSEPENCNERIVVRRNGQIVRVSQDGHLVPGSTVQA